MIDRRGGNYVAFASPDEVGALAKGAGCLGAGSAGAAAATGSRGFDNPPNIRFAYPREGAPLILYSYAIPDTARSPDAAYRCSTRCSTPTTPAATPLRRGSTRRVDAADLDQLKRLTPEPVFDPRSPRRCRANGSG